MQKVRKPLVAPGRFHSVIFRLLLTFFLLLTPIFAMGLTIYHVGISQLDQQISQMLGQQVSSRLWEIENQMELAQTQMSQLVNETGLLRLSGTPESLSRYERYDQLTLLQERLETLCDANGFVRQISLYLPRLQYMLRATSFDRNDWILSKLVEEEFEPVWRMGVENPNKVIYQDETLLYISQRPLVTAIGAQREPRMLFTVEYSLARILGRLDELIDGVQTRSLLLFADGRRIGDLSDAPNWDHALLALRQQKPSEASLVNLSDAQAYIQCVYSDQLDAWCLAYALRTQAFSELNSFRTFLLVLFALFAFVLSIYGLRTYHDVHKPLRLLTGAFDRLADGDMDFQISYDQSNEFSYLTSRFNRMLQQLKDTMSRLYQQRILMQQAQIKQLQAQINPHFLYNSLFILGNMIEMEDNESASLLSRKLGEYFRYITRDARNMVPLKEELEHARSYVEIQRIRFGRRLHIEFQDDPPDTGRILVPRLSLQPVLENAFVHALERSETGSLWVRLISGNDDFCVEIENTGFLQSEEWLSTLRRRLDDEDPAQEITGLINVHRRLKLIYGTGLTFCTQPPDRLLISFTFPINAHPQADGRIQI